MKKLIFILIYAATLTSCSSDTTDSVYYPSDKIESTEVMRVEDHS
jgi:hypothetical protein